MASEEWTTILETAGVPEGRAIRSDSPWGPLLVYGRGEEVFVVSNVCTHQGAPLHKGPVDVRSGTPIATCPAHGSMFDLATGAVRRGPAMHAIAAYDVRVEGEDVQVRPR